MRKPRATLYLAALAGLTALCGARLALAQDGEAEERRGWWGRMIERAEDALDARTGLRLLAPVDDEDDTALSWFPLTTDDADAPAPGRLVVLIHGLDEPGSVWDELSIDLRRAGWRVARFDYPNDQPIADSALLLGESLRRAREAGVESVDLVCHSMGGLVARDALTNEAIYNGAARGHEDLPDVHRLVKVGTPSKGSAMASLRIFGEWREHAERWLTRNDRDEKSALAPLVDGRGEAGRDLTPGSAYLEELNARERPRGVEIVLIVGEAAALEDSGRAALERVGGERLASTVEDLLAQVGDGVVPVESALWEGADEVVRVRGAHRTMLVRAGVEQWARGLAGKPPARGEAVGAVLEVLGDPPD